MKWFKPDIIHTHLHTRSHKQGQESYEYIKVKKKNDGRLEEFFQEELTKDFS